MLRIQEPIKDNARLERILEHFKKTSFDNYFFSMCSLHTGICLADLLQLRISDVIGRDYFLNKKNGFRFSYDKDMRSMLDNYIGSLPSDADYLFPSKRNASVPLDSSYASRRFCYATKELGESICHIQFVKTFALNYFLEHGNLRTTGICYPGTDIEKILRYLCLTKEEYLAYGSSITPAHVHVDTTMSVLSESMENAMSILNQYSQYIESGKHDPLFEAKAELFIRKLGLIIDEFYN